MEHEALVAVELERLDERNVHNASLVERVRAELRREQNGRYERKMRLCLRCTTTEMNNGMTSRRSPYQPVDVLGSLSGCGLTDLACRYLLLWIVHICM